MERFDLKFAVLSSRIDVTVSKLIRVFGSNCPAVLAVLTFQRIALREEVPGRLLQGKELLASGTSCPQ